MSEDFVKQNLKIDIISWNNDSRIGINSINLQTLGIGEGWEETSFEVLIKLSILESINEFFKVSNIIESDLVFNIILEDEYINNNNLSIEIESNNDEKVLGYFSIENNLFEKGSKYLNLELFNSQNDLEKIIKQYLKTKL